MRRESGSKSGFGRSNHGEVTFYSYPKLLFAWPLIVLGIVLWMLPTNTLERIHAQVELKVESPATPETPETPKAPETRQPSASADAADSAAENQPGQSDAADSATGVERANTSQTENVVVVVEPPVVEGTLVDKTSRYITIRISENEQRTIPMSDVQRITQSSWSETLGWIYLLLLLAVILTIGVDIERNQAVFWLAIFIAVWGLGYWLSDKTGFTVFGNIYRWFAYQNVRYSQGFGMAMSVLLGVPFIVMMIWSRLQHKWRITHNEFEHYSFGRADDSLARGAKRVRTTYPDLLELLLCGAGTLIVYSATGRQELRRIRHVPLLPLLRRRIDSILESTAVTQTDAIYEEEMEAEDREGGEEDEINSTMDHQPGQAADNISDNGGDDFGSEKL